MKRYLILFIVFAVLLNTYSFAVADDLSLNGEGAILIDYDSGRILYEKNAHKKLYPASTTKMMTAILTLEHGKMDDMVTIDPEIIGMTEGSHIALDYDEVMSVEDLLHALMIASANDAAAALGKYVAGSIDGFVKMMNDKARELGATNTNFTNPSGLHDDNHYSTAYDLYLIARYAMENKSFRELVKKSSYTIGPTNKKSEPRLLHTTNRFLYGNDRINVDGKTIPIRFDGVAGIKTGTTG
ncbi:MAG TPA: serine hydrolase, partial [Tissierellaceae bacterium]|nr:serine hydrolase [Tissierellaceae bacterium]